MIAQSKQWREGTLITTRIILNSGESSLRHKKRREIMFRGLADSLFPSRSGPEIHAWGVRWKGCGLAGKPSPDQPGGSAFNPRESIRMVVKRERGVIEKGAKETRPWVGRGATFRVTQVCQLCEPENYSLRVPGRVTLIIDQFVAIVCLTFLLTTE